MPINHVQQTGAPEKVKEEICLFAQTNFRNQMRRFGIKTDDRRRHMYVIGKTGMGKTTMLENMVLHDIYTGHGVGVVDPHGDFAEKILDFIPSNRINDVVYFNPSDSENPIGFNVLEVHSEEQKHLVAAGLMGVFKKIWPDVWSARMEYILNNVLLALLDSQGSTLLGINRMLSDKKYRKRVIGQIKDPVVKKFWVDEYGSWTEKYATEAGSAIQNKIGQFLSASIIRNMVAQVKSTINVREIMDSRKIFIMNLSKGRIGEDSSRLLGGMLITQIQLAAMERVDTPEKDRKDFFLYVDEFQNFATPSFANILSEARKYRLSLIMAHQYIAQLDEVVRDAVFGNVGTIVSFRVGAADAEYLAQEFTPTFLQEDIVNLSKFHVFLKLMIDGVASMPFSAGTMPPIGHPTANLDKVIRVSRERYGKKRAEIEDKIARWSGMEIVGSVDDEDTLAEKVTQTEETKKPTVKADEKVLALKELLEKKQTKPDTIEPAEHDTATPLGVSTETESANTYTEEPNKQEQNTHTKKEKKETPTTNLDQVEQTKKKRRRRRRKKKKPSKLGSDQSNSSLRENKENASKLEIAKEVPKQAIQDKQKRTISTSSTSEPSIENKPIPKAIDKNTPITFDD